MEVKEAMSSRDNYTHTVHLSVTAIPVFIVPAQDQRGLKENGYLCSWPPRINQALPLEQQKRMDS